LCKLTTGVPQGSVLEPLLFLLYINDLTNVSSKLKFTLFADDTTILYADKSLKHTLLGAANELKIVFKWFIANKLCLNVDKTYFMYFAGKSYNYDEFLEIGSYNIKCTQSTKFLCVFIDDKLSWSMHTSVLKTKLSMALGMLKCAAQCIHSNIC
jgi:hypothetical protein